MDSHGFSWISGGSGARRFASLWRPVAACGSLWRRIGCPLRDGLLAGWLPGWLAGFGWLAGWLEGGDVGWWMVNGDMEAETESPTRSSLEELGGFSRDM